MSHHDDVFPERLAEGSLFGVSYNTELSQFAGGGFEGVQQWGPDGLTVFDVTPGVTKPDNWSAWLHFFRARNGSAHSFLFKDLSDFTTGLNDIGPPSIVDQSLGTGDGVTTRFPLYKVYTSGAYSAPRKINYPIAASIVVGVDGIQSTAWSWDGNALEVVFTTAPAFGEVLTVGFEFHNRVRITKETERKFMRQRFSGGPGAISGRVTLIEDRDGSIVDEDAYHGGGSTQSFGADLFITPQMGLALSLEATAAGLRAVMPDITRFERGASWQIRNIGANSFDLRDDTNSSTLVTVAPAEVVRVGIFDSSGSKQLQGY